MQDNIIQHNTRQDNYIQSTTILYNVIKGQDNTIQHDITQDKIIQCKTI